ncbi:MAG: DUF1080 domain-containing protein [Chloroflexota bacterium]
MKKCLIILLGIVILVPISSFTDFNNPGKTSAAVKLFNGKNLDGWYTFIKDRGKNNDPKKVFTVAGGVIRISGEEFGCITTNEEFENYRLVAEFKWGDETFAPRTDKARDSGILLYSVGEDGGSDRTWMHSIECQVIEGGTGDFIVVGDGSKNFKVTCPVESEKQGSSYVFNEKGDTVTIYSGRINWFGRDPGWKDVKGFRGSQDVEKETGKWNRIECVANGKEILVYLNGRLVNHAVNALPRKGKIQIQSEGAEIFFRKITLQSL